MRGEREVENAHDPVFPEGLTLRRQGASLERVGSRAGAIDLLVSAPTLEIIEGTLQQGERITLVPSAGAVETYYILAGSLCCDLPSGPLNVGVGDCLVTESLASSTILSATEAVRFLYVTSSPMFHVISGRLNELMQLAVEVEIKDGYTAEHCLRLQKLSYGTGRELGLAPDRLRLLSYGAYLHDVGKITVPVSILEKPGDLTQEEWAVMRQHPIFGRELLETTFMRDAGVIVEQHHERMDGSGYPYGLAGESILTESYIVAVTDAYDAMTTERPYHQAVSHEAAVAELRRCAGLHYPAKIAEAFFATLKREKV